MTDQITPEKFIAELNKLKMTPEERKVADRRELGEKIGKIIGELILLALIATLIWAILNFVLAFSITWVKVLGAYVLFNIVKNSIALAFKK